MSTYSQDIIEAVDTRSKKIPHNKVGYVSPWKELIGKRSPPEYDTDTRGKYMDRKCEKKTTYPWEDDTRSSSIILAYEIRKILKKSKSKCHEKSKEEEIYSWKSKISCRQTYSRYMLHSFFKKCCQEKSWYTREKRESSCRHRNICTYISPKEYE